MDREELNQTKEKLEEKIASLQEEKRKTELKYENARIPGTDKYEAETVWINAIDILNGKIQKSTEELESVNEALRQSE